VWPSIAAVTDLTGLSALRLTELLETGAITGEMRDGRWLLLLEPVLLYLEQSGLPPCGSDSRRRAAKRNIIRRIATRLRGTWCGIPEEVWPTALPPPTRGRSPVRQFRSLGSVRGAGSNLPPYPILVGGMRWSSPTGHSDGRHVTLTCPPAWSTIDTLATMAKQSVPSSARRRPRAIPIGGPTIGFLLVVLSVLVLVARLGQLDYSVAFSAGALFLAASITGISLYNLAAERWRRSRLTAGWPRWLNRFLRRFQGWLVPVAFAAGLVLGHVWWQ
jgi:hypothetical protein